MTFETIILAAAKAAKVSGVLLLAICSHESNNFTMNYSPQDNGSPSFGICQIKYGTAVALGFAGKASDLMNPQTNATYAAKYLAHQAFYYGEDWVKLAASYNAGTYNPGKVFGCPRNLKYIKLVQNKLPNEFKNRLECKKEIADENF
jgi:soluble lytic murein transglycosylase-like protein